MARRLSEHGHRPSVPRTRACLHRGQRHGARCLRLDQSRTTRRHLAAITATRLHTCPVLSHAIPRRHRLTTPQKPHDSNGSVSKSEILVGELHATFPVQRTGALEHWSTGALEHRGPRLLTMPVSEARRAVDRTQACS